MNGKKKLRTWNNPQTTSGELNDSPSKTMPDMEINPRLVLENHVRGINPITAAVLDKQKFYGDNMLPYSKDLTFEELRLKRASLEKQLEGLNERLQSSETEETATNDGEGKNSDLPPDSGQE